jgi:Protein of unknown function (DUF3558)
MDSKCGSRPPAAARKSWKQQTAALAVTAVAAGLAACSSSPPGSGTSGSGNGSPAGPSTVGSLSSSKMAGLTKLGKGKLCGLLRGGEAAQILGAGTSAPIYANRLGLGVTCQWYRAGASQLGNDELYIGLSTIVDWQGTQGIDKLLHTSTATIDGHPAILAGPQHLNHWSQIDLALGGAHDPVAEYRAPTLAIATTLAQAVTPRLLALAP